MKRVLFSLFILALCRPAGAASETDYCPFVEEGKMWHIGLYRYFDLEPSAFIDYVINGDTIIAEKACKKIYEHYYRVEGDVSWDLYRGALTEDDGRVYFYQPESVTPGLLYDFNARQGDVVHLFSGVYENDVDADVIYDCVEAEKHCICLRDEYEEVSHTIWIEGVGSLKGPLANCVTNVPGLGHILFSCSVDGQEIYNVNDNPSESIYAIITGIHVVEESASALSTQPLPHTYFDLSGRRLAAPPAKGLFIEDGKVKNKWKVKH